jgi:hypothetical protein
VRVVCGIGGREVVCSTWGLSSSVCSEGFGFNGLSERVCGMVTGSRAWGGYVVVVVFTCCIVRFMPGQAFVVGRSFLGLLPI